MPSTAAEHDILTRLDSQVSDIRKLLWAIAGLGVAITGAAFYAAFQAGQAQATLVFVRADFARIEGEVRGVKADVGGLKTDVAGLKAEVTARLDRVDRDIAEVKAGVQRIEKALAAR